MPAVTAEVNLNLRRVLDLNHRCGPEGLATHQDKHDERISRPESY